MRAPLRESNNIAGRADRQNVEDRFEFVVRRGRVVGKLDDPRVDATTVQFDTNDGTDGNVAEAIGNVIVEGLVDPADIGDDANDGSQSLSAAFSESRRLNCSHVNSGRLRPK
jgi:hypothetical protein